MGDILLKVVNIAAEIAPMAKVGGLGDVVGGLSAALAKENIDVEVIIPKYGNINLKHLKNLKLISDDFKVFEKNNWQDNKIFSALWNGIKIILIENKNYFGRPEIYGYRDDVDRFLYFTKAALEFLNKNNYKIDILHLHDWHTAFAALMYKDVYSTQTLKIKRIVLSLHTLKYQGLCKPKNLCYLGLNGRAYLKKDKLQDPLRSKTLNLLKGGLICCDKLIPVSENYAREIQTKQHSGDLYATIKKNKKKIKGIVNGIDPSYWNPQKDGFIKYKYSSKSPKNIFIKTKNQNKEFLQKILNLKQKNVPLICSIGRLVAQKGPKLIKRAILQSIKKNAQFVLLGTAFDKNISKNFRNLKRSLKSNKNVSFNFSFNEPLSHKIFAAADFIIIPSLFEPCGLTQIIAFQYGCVPIVRQTGGLADTVFDLDKASFPKSKRNGFTFKEFSLSAADSALDRAIDFWYKKNDEFYSLALKNMKNKFSWKASAKKYIKEYKKLLK